MVSGEETPSSLTPEVLGFELARQVLYLGIFSPLDVPPCVQSARTPWAC
jgi:hypothetical protein